MQYLPIIKKGEYCSECRSTTIRVLSECGEFYICAGDKKTNNPGCGHRYYVTAKPKEHNDETH